mgnify:FL=1
MDSDYKSINEGAKMVALCAGIAMLPVVALLICMETRNWLWSLTYVMLY